MVRAQAHTLEGIVAGMIVLSGLVFALQVTAVTPLSASTSNQFIENQQQATADGVLATAESTGALERAVLFWNESGARFHDTTDFVYYQGRSPPNDFGRMLDRSFGGQGIAMNVHFTVLDRGGSTDRVRYVYSGEPSDNAATATRTVTVHDDDVLYDDAEQETDVNVTEAGDLYVPDADPGSGVYNVVRVEVTVWRM